MEAFIQESKRVIKGAINNNKLIVFVGAGVSANSGLPSWWKLVEEFAKGIGINSENINHDDYLKIPQYYYNARGHKEYYDMINKVFNVSVKPNPIHSLMVEMKPCHFITTNYDELIEDSTREKGVFYDIVSKDEDLPYTPNNNMIIKMHGDLSNKNIVLKEDDYLSYSSNFKLIENYIKALLSTHVVLLVGYSVNDIDVKLIFQWVKDILKTDFQPAYFLNVDSKNSIDYLEFNYYKNRGINILYYSEVQKNSGFREIHTSGLSDEKGMRLYSFLHYLYNDVENNELNLEYFYRKLSVLKQLNVIRFEDIRGVLNIDEPIYLRDGFIYVDDDSFLPLVNELTEISKSDDKFSNVRYCFINEIFMKAKVYGIARRDEYNPVVLFEFQKLEQKSEYNETDIANCLLTLNYKGIDEWLSKFSQDVVIEGNESGFLKNAYALYKTDNYYESYKILKRVSDSSFRNKNYLIFFISESNRHKIGSIIARNHWFMGIDPAIVVSIKNEIKKIDLESIYYSIPKQERKSIFFLREIFNFNYFYSVLNKVNKLFDGVMNDQNTVYIGSSKGKIHELQSEVRFFWEFINKNYLMVENYVEVQEVYKRYTEGILISLCIDESEGKNKTLLGLDGTVSKIYFLDEFSLFIMVSYMKKKDIIKLFSKYNIISLPVDSNCIRTCIDLFTNLMKSILQSSIMKRQLGEILNCMLIIYSKIDIGQDQFTLIIENLNTFIKSKTFIKEVDKSINSFLVGQINQFKHNINIEVLDKLLNTLLGSDILMAYDKLPDSNISELIYTISTIMHLVDPLYKTEYEEVINLVLEQNNIDVKLVLPLYNICNKKTKIKLKRKINHSLKKSFSLDLYFDSLLMEIIESKQEYEYLIIKYIDEIIISRDEEKLLGRTSFPDQVEIVLERVSNLFFCEFIKEPSLFNKYIGRNKKFDMFIDMENFDYREFDKEWIMEFPKKVHEKLGQVRSARNVLRPLMIELIKKDNTSKLLKEIFFTYYN